MRMCGCCCFVFLFFCCCWWTVEKGLEKRMARGILRHVTWLLSLQTRFSAWPEWGQKELSVRALCWSSVCVCFRRMLSSGCLGSILSVCLFVFILLSALQYDIREQTKISRMQVEKKKKKSTRSTSESKWTSKNIGSGNLYCISNQFIPKS